MRSTLEADSISVKGTPLHVHVHVHVHASDPTFGHVADKAVEVTAADGQKDPGGALLKSLKTT